VAMAARSRSDAGRGEAVLGDELRGDTFLTGHRSDLHDCQSVEKLLAEAIGAVIVFRMRKIYRFALPPRSRGGHINKPFVNFLDFTQ